MVILIYVGNRWNSEKFISYQKMFSEIKNAYPDLGKCSDEPNDTSKVESI
jgi:hypothetical protein